MQKNNIYGKKGAVSALLWLLFFTNTHLSFAQTEDSTTVVSHLSGDIFLTHNGISLVPTFSLGKPAVMFLFSIGKKRLTFEPDIRFALEGKPWAFLFWWRYKLVQNDKFSLRIGTHPALNFRTIPVVSNGHAREVIELRRFFAGEIAPNYIINKDAQVGIYYLYGHGFDDSQRHTHFLVLNSTFPNINLNKGFRLSVSPKIFFLKMDKLKGYYFSSTFRLYKRDTPIFLESIISQKIVSEILPEQGLIWNVSLVYSFNKQYTEVRPKI